MKTVAILRADPQFPLAFLSMGKRTLTNHDSPNVVEGAHGRHSDMVDSSQFVTDEGLQTASVTYPLDKIGPTESTSTFSSPRAFDILHGPVSWRVGGDPWPWDPIQVREGMAYSIMDYDTVFPQSVDSAYWSANTSDGHDVVGKEGTATAQPTWDSRHSLNGDRFSYPQTPSVRSDVDDGVELMSQGKDPIVYTSSRSTSAPFSQSPIPIATGGSKARRSRALTEAEKEHARLVRQTGACMQCRKRKVKVCDRCVVEGY